MPGGKHINVCDALGACGLSFHCFDVQLMSAPRLTVLVHWSIVHVTFVQFAWCRPKKKKKLLRLSAFPGASPKQPWYRRPGWPQRSIYVVSRQSLYLFDPPSIHIPSSEKPGIELPTDA